MKIGIFGIDDVSPGKENIIDERLDTLKQIARSAKKVYVQVELVNDSEKLKQCDGIIAPEDKKLDLILKDLEFVEKRIANTETEGERVLLGKLKEQLEKESFIYGLELTNDENKIISGYPLLSAKPVFLIGPNMWEDKAKVLAQAYAYSGYIVFFTGGEKEARAWSIKNGTTAWQASGVIHSDIQKGFIRAEVVSFSDLIKDGGISQARANKHLRLETKEYVVQDADVINFRFNK